MRFAADRVNDIATSMDPPAPSFDTANLGNDLGMEIAQTASVTISPIGNSQFRVFEKNDGDPSVYTAVDQNKPQENTLVRTEEIRGSDGGLAYPRESGAGVAMQEVAGKYTKDGNHLADAFEGGGTSYDRPYATLYSGGVTKNPNRRQIANLEQYDKEYGDWSERNAGGQWKAGTNSYVLDSNNPEDLEKLGYFMGTQ